MNPTPPARPVAPAAPTAADPPPVPPALPALVVGRVSHTRYRPVRHAFGHRHYQWLVDLDHLPRLPLPLRPLARFDARDHLDGGRGGGIRGDLSRRLREGGIELAPQDRVLMLAHPRVLGHTFDPLTVFWCLTPDGEVRAVVLEVHNTYGGRHAYVLGPDEQASAVLDKAFYVSPFNDVSGRYRIRLRMTPERIVATVVLERDGERVLSATVAGRPVPATIPALLRTVATHPLMPQRVSALIRLHGIRLWLRRLPVVPRTPPAPEEVVP